MHFCDYDPSPKGNENFHGVFLTFLKVIPLVLFWCIVPFIPLFLAVHHTILFYALLIGYIAFFIILNRIKMHYPWMETIVFIAFFLFCVLLFKSLIDYQVVEEKQVIGVALSVGTGNI